MALDPIDKEYLSKLRKIARERNVELALDNSRIEDSSYIEELRARYPLSATADQWKFASDIALALNLEIGIREATSAFACRRFIDANITAFREIAPTGEQCEYIISCARRHRIKVADEVFRDRTKSAEWIENFKSGDVQRVIDAMASLSLTHAGFMREAERAGIMLIDGDWTRTTRFLEFIVERYGAILDDKNAAHEAKRERARQMLRRNVDRYSVADALGLTDIEVGEIERTVDVLIDDGFD